MPAELILLVEDDESSRALMVRFLESLDYPPPLEALDARQALGLAQDRRPDLVLMDIGLPGDMDGVEAAQRIRAELGIPIIFVTGHGDPPTLERVAQAQPVGYLVKPVNRLGLYGAIKTGLERHRLERELAAVNEQLRRRQADLELQNLALRQAEQAIQEGHERYRQLFETNQAIKLVVDPEDGSIVDANQAACDFYGYSRREIVTKKVFDINPAPPEKIQDAMAGALAGGRLAFEFQHRLASGELRDVEVYTGPMNWGGRRLLHSIIHDVSQRRRAEEALRESQRQASFLADLLDHSSQPFAVAYPDGSLGRCNQAFLDLVGYSAQELTQINWTRDLTPPRWREGQ
ncbi:MAG: PAS domain S-box protein, partial [Desulfarculus sp.]|nr:PAS domain S-box protein [Desulfarculus sp.]